MVTHYQILEIKLSATESQIKDSYRRLVMIHHPDKNNGSKASESKFKLIQEAYEVLSDSSRRRSYDLTLQVVKPKTTVNKQKTQYSRTTTYVYNGKTFNTQAEKDAYIRMYGNSMDSVIKKANKDRDESLKAMKDSLEKLKKERDDSIAKMRKDQEDRRKEFAKEMNEAMANRQKKSAEYVSEMNRVRAEKAKVKVSSAKKNTEDTNKHFNTGNKNVDDWMQEMDSIRVNKLKEKEAKEFAEIKKKVKVEKPKLNFKLPKKVKIIFAVVVIASLVTIVAAMIFAANDDGSDNKTIVKQNEK